MATTILGLPESEIDRLLGEAETRLAANGGSSEQGQVVVSSVKAVTTTTAAAPLPTPAGVPLEQQAVKKADVSVRVPQLPQKKKEKKDNTGSDWFNMPRTNLTPELKRDLQVLRMRDVVAAGKQFFKKDNRKDYVPEFCQVGTIIAGATDGASHRLTRKQQKRTIVEEVLSSETTSKHTETMSAPSLLRPMRPLLQGRLPLATARPAWNALQTSTTQLRTNASFSPESKEGKTSQATPEEKLALRNDMAFLEQKARMPRSWQAFWLAPLKREAQYGVPSCDLQLRSYSIRNLEFFCDFALRAAYYLRLAASGPVPLPRMTEKWTVPRSHFIFKKSQENFTRTTLRRLIQIKDGHPETVQVWLAFLEKHAYYGIGMKANVWEFSKLDVAKTMDRSGKKVEKLLDEKWADHMGHTNGLKGVEDLGEFMAREKMRVLPRQTHRLFSSSSRLSSSESESPEATAPPPEKKEEIGPLEKKERKVIFSGIQPTGIPHLGNYLGALKQWKYLQDTSDPSTQLMYCIVDLHAITIPRPRRDLSHSSRDMLAALLAIGLDPVRSTIFYQSSVPGHSELQWILSCTASTGYLSRMTQWKSKLQAQSPSSSLETTTSNPALKHGLFSYPILQAADILVHRATHVPVGEDQRQHLEFARECVTNFNHTYSTNLFTPPETILSPAKRVMSLRDPTQKMSKSDPNPNSVILLTDDRDTIEKKIKSAVTDSTNSVSYDPEARKGVANLLEILSHLRGDGATPAQIAEEMNGMGLGALKGAVVDAVDAELAPIRERFRELQRDKKSLRMAASKGMWKARHSAEKTMMKVRKAMGLSIHKPDHKGAGPWVS
ncbi:hypothetical protein QBC34DRAFT_449413 [Podospora aff. communis PSN243]|uniref:Small ribosomal subunit protein uS10m n=1 Tax=Podospora aff. communis PSN243 TaxID=3040156 RepID=A0AAV9GIK2_9PEZI|nr:hypothetical protein QBC34DRAFT_449413 [Podospora aff. communis PSN243]